MTKFLELNCVIAVQLFFGAVKANIAEATSDGAVCSHPGCVGITARAAL